MSIKPTINYKKLNKKLRKTLQVYQKTESYNFMYAEFATRTDAQIVNNQWTWMELDVEKDKQDFLVLMTPAEQNVTVNFLKVFLKYEIINGDNYWSGRFIQMFPRPEFRRKAAWNAHQEDNMHGPFYNELNRILGKNTDEFYSSWQETPALKIRVDNIGKLLAHPLDLISLAGFNFLEGGILYSTFGFFKHYQQGGKNLLNVVVRGIDFSILDENNHARDSALAFNIVVREGIEAGILTPAILNEIYAEIYRVAVEFRETELDILNSVWGEEIIEGVTKNQLINFVSHQLNDCLILMNLKPLFKISDKTIVEWFPRAALLRQDNDPFQGQSREYNTGLDESKIKFNPEITEGY
jgi:ribonucleotide reductase beta subunit family protein with ferritin-like domain